MNHKRSSFLSSSPGTRLQDYIISFKKRLQKEISWILRLIYILGEFLLGTTQAQIDIEATYFSFPLVWLAFICGMQWIVVKNYASNFHNKVLKRG